MDISFEEQKRRVEAIKQMAKDMQQNDIRAIRLVDSLAIEALHEHGPIDPSRAEQAVFDIARRAALLMHAAIYFEDGELTQARAERDGYKKIAEEALLFAPPKPFIIAKPE